MNANDSVRRIRELVEDLNRYRDEYYNKAAPSVSDNTYDYYFDELKKLEDETGIRMANSPTQSVGYPVVSALQKVRHEIPLLSLDKTKSVDDLLSFQGKHMVNLTPKLDGLTLELIYENGVLTRASTRGDGYIGEEVTHNSRNISGVPKTIPYKGHLVVSGETFVRKSDFEKLCSECLDSDGRRYSTCRNFAAGAIRLYDSAECAKRKLNFLPFAVLSGLDDEYPELSGSKMAKLNKLRKFGFGKNRSIQFETNMRELMELHIEVLQRKSAEDDLPIDGIVICYDDIEFSKCCGRTGHHFKDGLAFKFEDEKSETVLRKIEWLPARNGEITPVAIFDTAVLDGCEVSRATLHNLSFVENLELMPGNRIKVSKRNMIIPHVEENLDRGNYDENSLIPKICPCCGAPTKVELGVGKNPTKTLHCTNPDCSMRHLKRFCHFVSKKALNIDGLSEATLERFILHGWLRELTDIFSLDRFEEQITALDGFGEKSWRRLQAAISNAKTTTFERFIISMDIPMVGNNASGALKRAFDGSLDKFFDAATGDFDFTGLPDFGAILNENIHNWFKEQNNMKLWKDMRAIMKIEKNIAENNEVKTSVFSGLTVVVTGKVKPYTRDEINMKIMSLGAKAGGSVTKKTDYLICGENAGSKLSKARELGVKVLTPEEFFNMAESPRN